MPALDLIPDGDVSAIIGYVTHLSLRGEAELRTSVAALGDDGVPIDVPAATARAWNQWRAATDPAAPGDVPDDDEAVRRGHGLFVSAGCSACHADYGKAEQYRYDAWGGVGRLPDLTRGVYRWGNDPSDLARRVRYGIPGTAMPASPDLTDVQVRDVVAFLRALPAPPRLPADVRDRVYPPTVTASVMRSRTVP
jgi:mono/diheme cytochrome c family protein